ncbi:MULTISPECIES: ABC transporter ATP-binding protein [unclassified Burkholderia]|uniref:ABC transporter ATP-binding protein n=1 Tax=unclassified Burkholderia TaxID=2613784 RepID=UPI000F572C78|nr:MULTISPECIES: ABC transporter ATP-binding protein [unclassified Burkholderia]RQS26460.1 ABC transporter ATP-binding protein [Burkholderia sp. Bp8995]RQS48438.1 ABC transporter ATP-binding protein [Burkholderia sp. Bp8989]
MKASVSIRHLSKSYGASTVLDDVSLDIGAGEFLTLLGPSGSGKTTLLMLLAGFTRASSGSIDVGGVELLTMPPHRREIGVVFQNYALFPHMSVAENVGYPLRLRGVDPAARRRRVEAMLEVVQLEEFGARGIGALSGGQRQRVALARALIFEPQILLLDEPLSALDKQLRERMQIEIRRLHAHFGTTTINVTHDQQEALTLSDRIAIVNGGRIAQVGTPAEIYGRPRSRFVAQFVGDTCMVPLRREGRAAWLGGVEVESAMPGEADPGDVWLALRPEWLAIVEGPRSDALCFEAVIRNCIYRGDSEVVYADLDGGHEVKIALPAATGIARPVPGGRVTVALPRERVVIVGEAA